MVPPRRLWAIRLGLRGKLALVPSSFSPVVTVGGCALGKKLGYRLLPFHQHCFGEIRTGLLPKIVEVASTTADDFRVVGDQAKFVIPIDGRLREIS